MYDLYFSPGTCALATQVVLTELKQPVNAINVQSLSNFMDVNPVAAVPALRDGDLVLTEGAAILLHLLDKHPNQLMPTEGKARALAIRDMMFANATMHPAYGRLFFIAQNLPEEQQSEALVAAAQDINRLWGIVDQRLEQQPFLGGESHSVADILLTVYSDWGAYFPVEIKTGASSARMIAAIKQLTSYQVASTEQQKVAAAG